MATIKNALLRYQTLDRCFRNPGRKYFWEDLLDECNSALYEFNGDQSGIKRRQLFDDIRFMESEAGWSIPLERNRNGRKVFYRYSNLDFSINNQPLNETELNQLQSGMIILSRFQGLPQLDGIQEIIPRLQKGAGPNTLAPVVGFDENPYLKGSEFIGELFNSIIYKKVLQIGYQDFKAEKPYFITFHPYYLKQYNNRWFVFGYNEYNNVPDWNLALDRIISIESTTSEYIENTEIDWNDYFEDIIGVTKPKGETPIDIVLWFDSSTAPYILTKPLHGSQPQSASYDQEGLTIKLRLIPNFEFYQVLLSFGSKVKVISPSSVAEKVRKTLENAIQNY
jgi:predicted DNA-binding transcriptional regulator YafY